MGLTATSLLIFQIKTIFPHRKLSNCRVLFSQLGVIEEWHLQASRQLDGEKKSKLFYIYSRPETTKTNSIKFKTAMLCSFYKHSQKVISIAFGLGKHCGIREVSFFSLKHLQYLRRSQCLVKFFLEEKWIDTSHLNSALWKLLGRWIVVHLTTIREHKEEKREKEADN